MVLNLSFIKQPYNVEGENGGVINYFNAIDESKPGSPILPSKTIIIAIPPGSKIRITMTDRKFEQIKSIVPKSNPLVELGVDSNLVYKDTRLSSKYFVSDVYPKEEFEIEGYTWIRDYYCAIIRINTHRYYWKKREIIELLSAKIKVDFIDVKPFTINRNSTGLFDSNLDNLILNINYANEFRSFRSNFSPVDSTGDWIDFGAEYLKLGVSSDGIYRILKSDLENFNIVTSSINPLTFKIFHKGNEIPIFVSGEEDGSLNDEDFIEFFGTMNYGSLEYRIANGMNEPFTEYIDRYTDTTIYWLTWGNDIGNRIDTLSYNGISIQDTIDYYTEISHYEQNNFFDYFTRNLVEWQNPEWIQNETWFWGGQGVGTVNRNFSVSDLVSVDSAKVYFRALSWASDNPSIENAHNLGISINSDPTVYDSGYIDKYSQKVLEAKFPTGLLQNGNNILKTIVFPVPGSDINMIVRDWYEVEYPRYIKLFNDSLNMQFKHTLEKKLYVIKIQNTSVVNQYIVYKNSIRKKRFTKYLQEAENIYFVDTVQTGDTYYISSVDKIHKPNFYYKKQFQNLRDSNIQSDYLLITHPYFEEEAVDYINFISENYAVTTKLINVLDIYDQFNYGFFKPEIIKDFLSEANQLWTNPKPSYVFLVGEANYDYHNYRLLADYTPNYVPSFGHPVSDNWFAIWDSVFTIPQMFVGRIPVKTKDELLHYLDKHSKYLIDPFNIWNKSYFLLSGGSNESEKSVSKGVNDNLRTNYITSEPIGGYTSQLYATENPKTNFGPFTQDYIDSVFNNGGIIVSYIGHSGTKIWDNGIENVDQLKNKYNKYPLINDFGCSTGKFAEPDIISFSESFTNGLDGEAIAYLGNSSLGFTSTSYNYPKLFYE
ncbi:MAG: C25 family cysteine peptidase, partial [Ignavibacteria bacterium]|nr:C25 family cysteine peptidase [Ignavibacteria bacterium]